MLFKLLLNCSLVIHYGLICKAAYVMSDNKDLPDFLFWFKSS